MKDKKAILQFPFIAESDKKLSANDFSISAERFFVLRQTE